MDAPTKRRSLNASLVADGENADSVGALPFVQGSASGFSPGFTALHSDIDPFEYTQHCNFYEYVKSTVVALTLGPIRLTLALLDIFIIVIFAQLATLGWPANAQVPLPEWRRRLLWPLGPLGRFLLLCMGFWHIKVKGKCADSSVAPVIVCNHVSFYESLILGYLVKPCFISKKENLTIPGVGASLKAFQSLLIDRNERHSRQAAAKEVRRRLEKGGYPPLMIFPEGTTTNGTTLLPFKAGAFQSGEPVQMAIARFPHRFFDLSWPTTDTKLSVWCLLRGCLCQVYNSAEVEFLDVYRPSEEEISDPLLYGQNVRKVMADHLRLPLQDTYKGLEHSPARRSTCTSHQPCQELIQAHDLALDSS